MGVVLYTTGCPRCKVLKSKLDSAGIEYEVCEDIDEMEKLGMMSAPNLKVDDKILNFGDAVRWIADKENDTADAEVDNCESCKI